MVTALIPFTSKMYERSSSGVELDSTSHALIAATKKRLAFSAGSACHAADVCHVSHVLAAMGCDQARGERAIRLSVGRFTSAEQVQQAARIIIDGLNTACRP